jgi:predicted kinase
MPALLIITGHPATGKTTLATYLASALHMPHFSKDGFKEALFDSLGWSDRSWSHRIGVAAIGLLYAVAERELAAGRSCIVESNFRSDLDTVRMRDLAQRRPFHPIQIRCTAAGDVLAERILARLAAGQRHPGHCDDATRTDLEVARTRGPITPLALDGPILSIDTTDPTRLDYPRIARWVQRVQTATAIPAQTEDLP